MKKNKKARRILHLLVIALLLPTLLLVPVNSSEQFFSGDAKAYYDQLVEDGFPATYAAALTELHLLHPQWSFAPLLITEGNADYTWQYVLEKETEDPSNNLVYASNTYRDYRHPLYTEQYDTGHYPVSKAGLAYFMDPRNFLNEADVFQFLDLSDTAASPGAVKAVLQGTFMEDAQLDNGILYADYIYDLGNELGVNPIYLAVKIRQEMGVRGTSPVISGTCGTLLADYYRNNVQVSDSGTNVLTPSTGYTEAELLELDGYYNYFNISASGNGTFTIYYKAMQAARKGTPSMAAEWGGSPSWDTRWKAIYGGAYVVKDKYVDAYQSTVYLQKFNVDSRASDNFWGQYAQNVTTALSEARTLFSAFASNEALDTACSFLIPVYEGMPASPSPDPAQGSCTSTRPASKRFDYSLLLRSPSRLQETNAPLYTNLSMQKGTEMTFAGDAAHDYGLTALEYSWDGDDWQALDATEEFSFAISADLFEVGEHILLLRGKAAFDSADSSKKSSAYVLLAVFYVEILPPPTVHLTVRVGDTETPYPFYAGDTVTLPTCNAEGFAGWLGDDGSFLPARAPMILREDKTYEAIFLDLRYLAGAAISTGSTPHLRFSAVMSDDVAARIDRLPTGSAIPSASLYEDTTRIETNRATVTPLTATDGSRWHRLHADTPTLTREELSTPYAMHFFLRLRYTDGSEGTLYATGYPSLRAAKDVAEMALNDPYHTYSPEEIARLTALANTDSNAF